MYTIEGKYTNAKIFTTDNDATAIEPYALDQLYLICNSETSAGSRIRVMPDVHPGKVGTVGLTMTVEDKIMPHLVGIDIGCGISMAEISCKTIEFQKLDAVIRDHIPTGFAIRQKVHSLAEDFDLSSLYCYDHIRKDKALLSLGTLGSGNHFIELGKDERKNIFLTVHSGSRHLGKEVAEYYLREGQKELKEKGILLPYEMTYLEGELMQRYLHDLQIIQDFAAANREIILMEIARRMKWKIKGTLSCIHNYVDASKETIDLFHAPMLRKGAISAKGDELVIIPINMKQGILLGYGKDNVDWNCSAPHGAGRIMKREDVKSHFTVSAYKTEMKGVYSSCIGKDTLDEAPFVYRGMDEIADAIKDTVDIERVIRPIYNYKAGKSE